MYVFIKSNIYFITEIEIPCIVPEIILHGLLMFVLLISWSPWLFLLNLPMVVYHIYRYVVQFQSKFHRFKVFLLRIQRNEHLLDPTEILRFKKLNRAKQEAIAKTVFYGLQVCYAMYW